MFAVRALVLISLLKTLFSLYRVSQMGSIGGGQSGQNGQKLHEIYKINYFGGKQWRKAGRQANFSGSGGIHPVLSH